MFSKSWLSDPAMRWAWLPWILLAVWTFVNQALPPYYVYLTVSETGFIEWLQFFIAAFAFLGCLFQLRRLSWKTDRALYLWFMLAALGCLYIAGEEISWGQWIFYWDTPEHLAALNDQSETNLHNISSWLDQKPQMLLEIGMVMGGLILPWVNRRRPQMLPPFIKSVLPNRYAAFTVAAYLFVKINWMLQHATGFNLYIRASEIIETVVYYFLAVYAWSFWKDQPAS